jgi:exopolyphosphatase/guanosine-5'-triphosphate,3'-diphosphate pyrophosphatase
MNESERRGTQRRSAGGETLEDREGALLARPGPFRPEPAGPASTVRPEPGARRNEHVYAALDLGTNNCRLLIARPVPDGFRVIDAFSRIVRLGEGLSRTGRLAEPAMGRALEALTACRQKMQAHGVTRARLITTEACRSAANGHAFLDRVRRETGLRLEIVDRRTEAMLAVSGCASLMDPAATGVLIFDIGGGSTEVAWLEPGGDLGPKALARNVRSWVSLPLGVVTLAERFGGVRVNPALFGTMVEVVRNRLSSFPLREAARRRLADAPNHLLGTSGTVTTIAGLHLGLTRYDRRKVDGLWLEAPAVDGTVKRLLGMSYEDRVRSPCIGVDRADLVLAGCAILEAIRREFPCERLRVADRGLREGILASLMAEDAMPPRESGRRRRRGGRRRRSGA